MVPVRHGECKLFLRLVVRYQLQSMGPRLIYLRFPAVLGRSQWTDILEVVIVTSVWRENQHPTVAWFFFQGNIFACMKYDRTPSFHVVYI